MFLGMINRWSEAGFRQVRSFGLKAVEFCLNGENAPADLESILPDLRKWSREYGVRVGSMGCWGTDKIDGKGSILEDELKTSCRYIDIASELECPVFNTGVNYVETLSYLNNCNAAVDFLSKLVDHGKRRGVRIATYNCHWNNFIDRPKAWELVHGSLPGLGIKFDPSHCVNTGSGDYLAETIDWGSRFYHFHIKGVLNVGGRDVDAPPAGLDMINWRALLGALYATHYDGMLGIEPHSPIWSGDLGDWGIRLTIDYISKLVYNVGE